MDRVVSPQAFTIVAMIVRRVYCSVDRMVVLHWPDVVLSSTLMNARLKKIVVTTTDTAGVEERARYQLDIQGQSTIHASLTNDAERPVLPVFSLPNTLTHFSDLQRHALATSPNRSSL